MYYRSGPVSISDNIVRNHTLLGERRVGADVERARAALWQPLLVPLESLQSLPEVSQLGPPTTSRGLPAPAPDSSEAAAAAMAAAAAAAETPRGRALGAPCRSPPPSLRLQQPPGCSPPSLP
jgi:hypothetical protein